MTEKYAHDAPWPNVTPAARNVMRGNKRRDTSIERYVRSSLHQAGYRFNVDVAALPGRPDVVLPRYRTVVFVHGCYWHGHSKCGAWAVPRVRSDYWTTKIAKNQRRDARVARLLRSDGWRVFVIRECALDAGLARIIRALGPPK